MTETRLSKYWVSPDGTAFIRSPEPIACPGEGYTIPPPHEVQRVTGLAPDDQ